MPQVVPGVQDPTATREELDAAASRSSAPRGDVARVLLDGGSVGSLTGLVGREGQRRLDDARELLGFQERSRTLTPEEATELYGIEGQLTFNRPISEREAMWRQSAKRDELGRLDILQRNDSIGGLEAFGLSILGGLVDPVAVPLNFVPVIGQEQLAARIGLGLARTRGATALRGAAFGAVEGAAIGGAQEALVYGLAGQREGRDYDLDDLMLGVTANALFGGGVRGALEGLGWQPPRVAGVAPEPVRVTRGGDAPTRTGLGGADPVAALIREQAAARGEDPETAVAIAMIESRLNPNAKNPESSAAGVFQFIDDTWAEMGGGNKFDASLNVQRGVQLMAQNRAALTRALGRDPAPWELYLAHQQGSGGAIAMLRNPDRPAVDVLQGIGVSARRARASVRLNAGDVGASAGEFAAVWRRKYAEVAGDAPTVQNVRVDPAPEVVSMLSQEGRVGAMARALDDMANDRAVNVGRLIDSELMAPGRARPTLDDAPDAPITIRHQPLEGVGDDVAVTVRGTEVPVRYAIVEAEDLITSHDDDLIANPQFPGELQPRDRERAGSQARLLRMEKEFNPRRLMASPDAESGAPIIAGDGVVESGNGRSIMVRRNMRRGTPVDRAYRGELTRRGYDVAGFDKPVLVRIRTQPMEGGARVKLTAEMNGDVTERLSATEQAFADAQAIDDNDLALFQGGEITSVPNDAFARRFVDKAGAGQENDLVDGTTQRLSLSGVERVQAAMVARAYGDRALVYALFETQDNTIKAIGKGLMGAAPDWARMRAASARGELATGADTTEALTAAVALVRHARENRIKLGELVEDWADQDRLLGGEALSPSTKAYLRTFFLDDGLKKPSSADHIAETLRATATRALDTTPGPDLFGDTHAFDAATILDTTSARLREEAGDADAGLFGEGAGPAPDADRGGNGERQPEASGGPRSEGGQGGRPDDAGAGAGNRPDDPSLDQGPRPVITRETLWERTPEELRALLEEAQASDQQKLVMALGEDGAAEFKRLDRKQNNSYDGARADEGAREFEARFGDDKLTDRQKRLIYGIDEVDASADDIRVVLDAHGDVLPDDPADWAAYMGAVGVRGATVDELMAVPRGEGSPAAQAAFVRLQSVSDYFAAQGVDANDLPRMMASALVRQGGWKPDQAAEIIGGFVEAMTAGRRSGSTPDNPRAALKAPTTSDYESARIQRMRDALASGRMINGLDVDPETRALFEGEIAAFDRARPADGEAPAAKAAPARPMDPELTEIEAEISAMDAELAVYAASGRLDPDLVAAVGDDLVDQETLQLAIDTAAACLAEGGA